MPYRKLTKINEIDFSGKRVLLLGGGWMGSQYCRVLKAMRVKDVMIITNTERTAIACKEKFGYKAFSGGYGKNLSVLSHPPFDLVIIALPINQLIPATRKAIEAGNDNILVEKPGSLYSSILEKFSKEVNDKDSRNIRIRIAFNRLLYPSLWKLKDIIMKGEEITSCFYTFTEWVHTINFDNNIPECYQRWGIANSLHVISMAHFLIGLPKEISAYRTGTLSWHPSGSRFVGAGITENNVPFSYHADWESSGRWGIMIMTSCCAYRLIPLEQLYRSPKDSINFEQIEVTPAFPGCKEGIAEEVAIMLESKLENDIPLVTLERASSFVRLAEKIFGYSDRPRNL